MSFKSFNKKGKAKASGKKGFAEALANAKGKGKSKGKGKGKAFPIDGVTPGDKDGSGGEAPTKKKVKLKFKK